MEHKFKVSKCTCENQTIRGNCVKEISSKIRGTASKCSSSSSRSYFSSIFSSSFNPNSDSNLRSRFTDYNSNSTFDSNLPSSVTDSNSHSNSSSNSGSNSNSNLQNSWGTKGEAPLACRGQIPFTDSILRSSFTDMQSNCMAIGESPLIELI